METDDYHAKLSEAFAELLVTMKEIKAYAETKQKQRAESWHQTLMDMTDKSIKRAENLLKGVL